MFKAMGAAALLLLTQVQPALAADAPGVDRKADCPDKTAGETNKAYGTRALDYCQVSWTRLVDARQTGGQTQGEYVNACAKRCGVNHGLSGTTLALIVLGLAAVGGAAAAAGGGGGSHPASP
jgi:hypothetical protein